MHDRVVNKGIDVDDALAITNYREWNKMFDAKTTSNASMKGQQSLLRQARDVSRYDEIQVASITRLHDKGITNPTITEAYIQSSRNLFNVEHRYDDSDDDDDWDDDSWDEFYDDDEILDDVDAKLEIPLIMPLIYHVDEQQWFFDKTPKGWTQKLVGKMSYELVKLTPHVFEQVIKGATFMDRFSELIYINNFGQARSRISRDLAIIEKVLERYYKNDDIEKAIGITLQLQLKCPKESELIDKEFSKRSAISETYTQYKRETRMLLDEVHYLLKQVQESCMYYIHASEITVFLYNKF